MSQIKIESSIEEMVNRLMDLDLNEVSEEELDKKLKVAEKICQLGEVSIKSREQENKLHELEMTNKRLNIEALRLADQMNVCVPENTILEITHDGRK